MKNLTFKLISLFTLLSALSVRASSERASSDGLVSIFPPMTNKARRELMAMMQNPGPSIFQVEDAFYNDQRIFGPEQAFVRACKLTHELEQLAKNTFGRKISSEQAALMNQKDEELYQAIYQLFVLEYGLEQTYIHDCSVAAQEYATLRIFHEKLLPFSGCSSSEQVIEKLMEIFEPGIKGYAEVEQPNMRAFFLALARYNFDKALEKNDQDVNLSRPHAIENM